MTQDNMFQSVSESPTEDEGTSSSAILREIQSMGKSFKAELEAQKVKIEKYEQELSEMKTMQRDLLRALSATGTAMPMSSRRHQAPPVPSGPEFQKMFPNIAQPKSATPGRPKSRLSRTPTSGTSEDEDGAEAPDITGMMTNQNLGGVDMSQLVQLQMLQMLKEMSKKKKHGSSSDEGSEAGGDWIDSKEALSSKGFKGIHTLRRSFRKKPKDLTRQYIAMCKNLLGVHRDDIPWQFKDVSRRLMGKFGKQRGLHRCHTFLSQLLEMLVAKDWDHATAYCVQVLKCLHQVALDQGKWSTGELFVPLGDSLDMQSFGGTEEEMTSIHGYLKAMKELKGAHQGDGKAEPRSEEEEGEQREGAPRLNFRQRQAAAAKKKEEAAKADDGKGAGKGK